MPDYKIQPEEIRDMHPDEIRKTIQEQKWKLMRERSSTEGVVATGESSKDRGESPGVQSTLRRNVARLKTILNEKKRDKDE